MKHPTPEDWMDYLYGEQPEERRLDCQAHLAVCPDCRQHLASWQQSQTFLDGFQLPQDRTPSEPWKHWTRWGLAASLFLAAGFALGHSIASSHQDLASLRNELRASIAQEIQSQTRTATSTAQSPILQASLQTQQQLAAFIHAYRTARLEDRQFIAAQIEELERKRLTDYAVLRRDLDTVAVVAESRIEQTREQLAGLTPSPQPSEP